MTIIRGKGYRKKAVTAYKIATSRYRARPDFIILGGKKCGTTSLYSYLSQNPKIGTGSKKEIHYFDSGFSPKIDVFKRPFSWYLSHFPIHLSKSDSIYFEATPFYLFHPLAPERIYKHLPDSKLIILLRDPVERAISDYRFERQRGRETLPMDEAFAREDERVLPKLESRDFNHIDFVCRAYCRRGLYAKQIEGYLKYFNRDRIFIGTSEELFSDPQAMIGQIETFLDVAPNPDRYDVSPKNVTTFDADVNPALKNRLIQYFEEPNERLFSLLGRDLDWQMPKKRGNAANTA